MLKSTSSQKYFGYEKIKKIGEGTFATVYLGHALVKKGEAAAVEANSTKDSIKKRKNDTQSTHVKIAIKRIKVGLFQDGLDMSAIREIKYLKELKHANIIDLMDVVAAPGGGLNLILEFLDADLEMIIKNKKVVFSGADVKAWTLMLFRGLHFCHSNFILHRDLKPNNLLLARDGTLKIADFGLARMYADPQTAMTSQVVTRWYRCPELLLGAKHYGPAVDIWSCGCIFAEIMLRTPYFAAESDIGQLNVIFKARGTPTEKEWPGLANLPDYFEFAMYPPNPLRSIFTAASSDALDLLDKLLYYNPLQRPSCLQALSHAYFTNLPRPTRPDKLPRALNASSNTAADAKRKRQEAFEFDEEQDDLLQDPGRSNPLKVARKLF